MRLIRTLLYVLAGLVVLIISAFIFVPRHTIAENAITQLEAQIDREIEIGEDIGLALFPNIGVTLRDVRIGNADWSTQDWMVEAGEFSVGVELAALIQGDVVVQQVKAIDADIFLHRATDGRANWNFDLPTSEQTSSSSSETEISIQKIAIENAMITYLDGDAAPVVVENLSAVLSRLSGGPASRLSLALGLNGEEVSVQSDIADLDALLDGLPTNVDLTAEAAGADVSFSGSVSTDANVSGQISGLVPDVDRLMAAFGQSETGITGPVELDGTILVSDGEIINLDGARLVSDPLTADISLDVSLMSEKPVVNAVIEADVLGKPSQGSSEDSELASWSNQPIDASALGQVDGVITIEAGKVYLGPLEFSPATATVTIDNARAVAELTNLSGYGGNVTGRFVANNRNGFSVGGALNVAGIELQPFLTATSGITRFTGTGNLNLEFLGVGNSMNDIMNSLSGLGSMDIGSGTIAGVDLDRLFRGQPNGGTTIFDSMSATWEIGTGILTNEDLLMILPNVESAGLGKIGLGKQTIDYTLVPTLKLQDGGSTIFPVRVEGSWSDPKIYPDLKAMVNQDLGAQAEALKDEVKNTVEDEIRARLGLPPRKTDTSEPATETATETQSNLQTETTETETSPVETTSETESTEAQETEETTAQDSTDEEQSNLQAETSEETTESEDTSSETSEPQSLEDAVKDEVEKGIKNLLGLD